MGAAGEATAEGLGAARARSYRPTKPGEGEAILWEGRPHGGLGRAFGFLAFLTLLGLLSWLALELIRPHLGGSPFAGQPTQSALPLILAMMAGMVAIIALPVWLRSSARARARYMLTNRRALVWLGDRIIGEAILFGAEMETLLQEVLFRTPNHYLDWRLKDEGTDRVRFERISAAQEVARMAEEHGARWVKGRPEDPA
jgi:hypothetical protein